MAKGKARHIVDAIRRNYTKEKDLKRVIENDACPISAKNYALSELCSAQQCEKSLERRYKELTGRKYYPRFSW